MADSRHNKNVKKATAKMWRVPNMTTRRKLGGGGTLSLASGAPAVRGPGAGGDESARMDAGAASA